MEKLEKLEDICTYKVMVNDKSSTTFQQVKRGHRLYNCVECPGTTGSCPNYSNYNKLVEKYENR